MVKYSSAFLSGKVENLEPILADLELKVLEEIKEVTSIGLNKIKKEHVNAWNDVSLFNCP